MALAVKQYMQLHIGTRDISVSELSNNYHSKLRRERQRLREDGRADNYKVELEIFLSQGYANFN